jgi:hypothetical protein
MVQMRARSHRMDFSNQSLASWATILGMVISVLGLVQSRGWLTAIGVFFIGTSIVAVAYARRERLVVSSANVQVEGRSIDSLNIANLRRRVNRSLVIQDAHHLLRARAYDTVALLTFLHCGGHPDLSRLREDNPPPADSLRVAQP